MLKKFSFLKKAQFISRIVVSLPSSSSLTDSEPPLIHHHTEGETLLQHLAWRQTNSTYYIQQKKKTPQSHN